MERNEAVSQDEGVQEMTKEGDRYAIGVWTLLQTIGSHFVAVQGVAGEPRGGAFLLSVSPDQATCLHAE